MKIPFLTLTILTIASMTIYGQSADSVVIKNRLAQKAKNKLTMDSLETAFYSEPAFFKISFELNQQRTSIPEGSKFYATDGLKNFESIKTDSNKYQFDNLPDSVKFGLEVDTFKIETGFVKRTGYKSGATMTFGYYDNVIELRRKWKKGKKNDDFNEWTDIGHAYLIAVKDKEVIKAAKKDKIKPIEFVIYNSRVFGDGTVQTFQNVELK